jgi:amino acid transporter, AAT family
LQLEYWLSLLKVITITVSSLTRGFLWTQTESLQVFIIMGIVVNAGGNLSGHYIGGENWRLPGAPFHGGIGGFASVFVTASFACKFSQP